MSKKSRNSGKNRPSREDLLKELESIHQTLISDTEVDHDILSPADDAPTDTSEQQTPTMAHQEEELATAAKHQDTLTVTAEREAAPDTPLADQQSLFMDADAATQFAGETSTQKVENLENPFLPQHMKERLEKEKSLYQREIDSAVSIPGLNPYAEKATVKDAIIDELVKIYLPQIEEDLRRRLKQNSEHGDD